MILTDSLAGTELSALDRLIFRQPWDEFPLDKNRGVMAAENDCVLGFLYYCRLADESEIQRLGVLPGFRRHGVGTFLLRNFLSREFSRSERIFLEVDQANTAAVVLYRQAGFREMGRREKYYEKEHTAIIMAAERGTSDGFSRG